MCLEKSGESKEMPLVCETRLVLMFVFRVFGSASVDRSADRSVGIQ